jgi:hypothetical protein
MSKDDIIRMAKEAGASEPESLFGRMDYIVMTRYELERFFRAAYEAGAAAEREACAKVCEEKHHTWRWDDELDSPSGPRDCVAAIKARGN